MIPAKLRRDQAFVSCATEDSGYEVINYSDDIERIQKILSERRNIQLSVVEVVLFWNWRSDEFDASWLVVHNEDEVLQWYDKFMENFVQYDDWFEMNMKNEKTK